MLKRLLLFPTIIFFVLNAFAQSPPPSNLSGQELRTWLKSNWYDGYHSDITYSGVRSQMYSYVDVRDGKLHCVYSGYNVAPSSSTSGVGSMNCEHTIPQSWFGEALPMRSDIHHLYPTHERVNNDRSSYPFGDVDDNDTDKWYIVNSTNTDLSITTTIPSENIDDYSELLSSSKFEPLEDHKGNVARAIFYFYTMYPTQAGDISKIGDLNTIYRWHLDDPVDSWEQGRNQRAKEVQGNSNPYIELPELVCIAWGFACESNTTVSPPLFSLTEGTYQNEISVTMSCYTPDAVIYYTTDGTTPTDNSTIYTTAIQINVTTELKAIAVKDGLNNSAVTTANYEITNIDYIFYEDFETVTADEEIVLTGWKNIAEEGVKKWEGRFFNINNYAQMSAYQSVDVSNIVWLISPTIDLTNTTSPVLSFITKDGYNNGDALSVWISEDYDDSNPPSNSTWIEINAALATGTASGYADDFTASGNIDLSNYIGKNIVIAFKYTGGKDGITTTFQIDDITIVNDAEIPDNIAPVSAEGTFKIYPNPTNSYIIFEKPDRNSDDVLFQIYSISGKCVLTKQIQSYSLNQKIDISTLKEGIYIVKIISDNNTYCRKLNVLRQ